VSAKLSRVPVAGRRKLRLFLALAAPVALISACGKLVGVGDTELATGGAGQSGASNGSGGTTASGGAGSTSGSTPSTSRRRWAGTRSPTRWPARRLHALLLATYTSPPASLPSHTLTEEESL
jgi:hypothetical protein